MCAIAVWVLCARVPISTAIALDTDSTGGPGLIYRVTISSEKMSHVKADDKFSFQMN